jgi:hypothetical protein
MAVTINIHVFQTLKDQTESEFYWFFSNRSWILTSISCQLT